jgi:hypothetical protein
MGQVGGQYRLLDNREDVPPFVLDFGFDRDDFFAERPSRALP